MVTVTRAERVDRAHRRYLRELVLPHPAQRVVLEDAIRAIGSAEERIARLEDQMQALLESWPMKPVVAAMMALHGFARVSAMVLVSELGSAWRFAHPRQLMAYLGLVPTENTSDQKRRQGGITKTGNSHARWLLIEAAQHYRLSPKVSKELSMRQEGQCAEVKACAWKAQTRLHKRMMQLCARGKERNKVTVAVAGVMRFRLAHLPDHGATSEPQPRHQRLKKRVLILGGTPPLPSAATSLKPAKERTTNAEQRTNSHPSLNRDRGHGAAVTVIRFTRVVGGVEPQGF